MRKLIGVLCVLLGILCILSSIGLVAYNRWEEESAEEMANALLEEVHNIIDESQTELPLPNDTEMIPTETESMKEMESIQVGGYDCIGILSIPVIELELPVLTDWDYVKLKNAPCHYYGTYYEKNFVIAAHYYKSHFGRISELEQGDIVIFTDVNGVEYYYEVVLLETLPKEATKEMITSDFDLSLYTCTPGGANRVTVRCSVVEDT